MKTTGIMLCLMIAAILAGSAQSGAVFSGGMRAGTLTVGTGHWDQTAAPGDVVINELMWMGSLWRKTDQWIELRNTTGRTVSIGGWILTRRDGHAERPIATLPRDATISPGGYYLISRYPRDRSEIDTAPDYVAGNDLALTPEKLTVTLYAGRIADDARIDAAGTGGKPPAGFHGLLYHLSMERTDQPGNGTDPHNWYTCRSWTDGMRALWDRPDRFHCGTPGTKNLPERTTCDDPPHPVASPESDRQDGDDGNGSPVRAVRYGRSVIIASQPDEPKTCNWSLTYTVGGKTEGATGTLTAGKTTTVELGTCSADACISHQASNLVVAVSCTGDGTETPWVTAVAGD